MSTPFRLLLPTQFVSEMFAQARAALPNECCGLLAGEIATGDIARVIRRYPLVNAASNPSRRYLNEGKDLLTSFRDMREYGMEHVAIYHSHPTSEAVPSKTDREVNYYGPEMVHFIISLKDGTPVMRGWRLTADNATEAVWETF